VADGLIDPIEYPFENNKAGWRSSGLVYTNRAFPEGGHQEEMKFMDEDDLLIVFYQDKPYSQNLPQSRQLMLK